MKKILAVLLFFSIGLSGCGDAGDTQSAADTPAGKEIASGAERPDIIAQVGDDLITKDDIAQILSQIPAQFKPRYATLQGRRELVDAMVSMKMLAWEARRRKINEREDMKVKIDYIIDQTLARALEEELRENIKIEDATIEKYYKENQDKYVTPAKVKARHILVESEDEAGGILAEIRAGGDFAELAGEKSTCPSAGKGGDLGWFERGKMDPAFEKAAFELKKGEVSNVVKSSFGYHIIKVENIRPAKTKDLDQARKSIERTMAKDLLEKEMAKLKEKISAEAAVVVNEEYFSTLEKESGSMEEKTRDKDSVDTKQGE